MPIKQALRSALIAASLGAATATMLAAVVLPSLAQTAPAPGTVFIDNFTFGPTTLTVKAGTNSCPEEFPWTEWVE